MPSLASDLSDQFIRHSVDLMRLEASERRVVLKMLKGLENDLVTRLLKTEGVTLAEPRKLEALFVATEELIRTAYKDIGIQQRASLIKAGEYEVDQTKAIVNDTVGVSLMTVGVPLLTIKALVDGDTVLGLPAKDWWLKQSTTLKAAFQDTMRRGVFAGDTLNELARRVRGTRESGFTDGIMGGATRGARRNAEALIRTSLKSILGAARDETLRANDDVIAGQQWLSVLDPRTCVICMALSLQSWDFDGNKLAGTTEAFPGPPPAHFSCFPGNTLVSASDRIAGKSQRWYEGEVFVVSTSAGHNFTCTPNHPILTRHGWLSAHLLKKGQDVVRSLSPEWTDNRNPHNNNMPTRIEDLTVPTFSPFGMQSHEVPITAEDFHGDVVGSKIAVITTDRQLWNKVEPPHSKQHAQFIFGRRHPHSEHALFGLSNLISMDIGMSFPTHSIMRGLRQARSLSWCHAGMSHPHSITGRTNQTTSSYEALSNQFITDTKMFCEGRRSLSRSIARDNLIDREFDDAASSLNPRSFQSSPDAREADTKLAREIMSGETGPIALDKVVRIEHKLFHGYVYNLQTVNKFYMANGIIAHNCRCDMVPLLKSWEQLAQDAGGNEKLARKLDRIEAKLDPGTQASMGGPVSSDMDFSAWLKTQSVTEQKSILGPGKWQLWSDGKLGLTDLVDFRGQARTLEQLKSVA